MIKDELNAFIAYSFDQRDRQITLKLKRILIELGVRPIPGDIGVDPPAEQVLKKMNQSDFVIVLLTKRYPIMGESGKRWMTSEWIYNEIGMAYTLKKPMIFLCERGLRSGGIKESVAGIQYFKRETFPYIIPRLGQLLSEVREKLDVESRNQTRVTEFMRNE